MRIQCTKKLLERMKISIRELTREVSDETPSEFFCWHANIVKLNRRNVIIFVNNSTRVMILCDRPKASDYKKIGELLEKGIRELFDSLGVHMDVKERYFALAGDMEVSLTGTRSQVAKMNKMAEMLEWGAAYFGDDRVLQTAASVRLAEDVIAERKGFFIPKERLFTELCGMMGVPQMEWDRVRTSRSYVMRIAMDLQNSDIYRVIEIPENAVFWHLHKVIQKSFGWFDCHLHMFTVYDEEVIERQGRMYYEKKRKLVIFDRRDDKVGEYWDHEEQELRGEWSVMLSEVFRERNSCVYTYDFGDGWEHVITVLERKKEGDGRFKLLESHGERPPENVGGEEGFEKYLRIISNKDDPEYEQITKWAERMREQKLSIEEINSRIGWLWM